jgi:type II secretory pathway predicted ATPase ExeA
VSVLMKVPPAHDATKEGVRIVLGVVAAELGITATEMADHVGISRRTFGRLITENVWPQKCDREAIKQALRDLLARRGAAEDDLLVLFHQHQGRRRHRPDTPYTRTDRYGRPLDRNRPGTADPDPLEEISMLMAKQTLSQAARKQWSLFTNPFDGSVQSEEQMFVSPEIAYVREAARQAAVGARFVAIVGESGAGKSTILEDLEAHIERSHEPVVVIRPSTLGMEESAARGTQVKAQDILHAIVTALDPRAVVKQTMQARTEQVKQLLVKSAELGFKHMVLIEEAHRLPDATLKHLKGLNEIKLGRRELLGVLLLAQTELAVRLDPRKPELREVTQRCEVVRLLPLDGDLQAYLAHRAKIAGRKLEEFVDASAIDEMRAKLTVTRAAAGGKARAVSLLYPLAVNNLMTAALNMAAELGAPVVDRNVVRGV